MLQSIRHCSSPFPQHRDSGTALCNLIYRRVDRQFRSSRPPRERAHSEASVHQEEIKEERKRNIKIEKGTSVNYTRFRRMISRVGGGVAIMSGDFAIREDKFVAMQTARAAVDLRLSEYEP